MSKLLTVQEVADIFRRSAKTIYRWIEEGEFEEVIKVKDGYLIPEKSVNKKMEECKITNGV